MIKKENKIKVKLIYNPRAGAKRKLLNNKDSFALEDLISLLKQYQIEVDYFPTRRPGHATELAASASGEGYNAVIAAGGDGTVSEVANGLINTDIPLGIIPLGTFMNIARMLSIPTDLEKAVAIIKIGRTRKIDVGKITMISGERISDHPSVKIKERVLRDSSSVINTPTNTGLYFLESAGIGLDAELQEQFLEFEQGNFKTIFKMIKTYLDYYIAKSKITIDNEVIETKASLIAVSNGPFTGAALPISPQAKLNDHRLSVTIYKMSKFELVKYFLRWFISKKITQSKIQTYKAKKVKIESRSKRIVHTDARVFGTTPIELEIIPNALNVISGFPKDSKYTLMKRTYLDP